MDGDLISQHLPAPIGPQAKPGDEKIPKPLSQGEIGPVVDVVPLIGIQQGADHIVAGQGPKAQGGKTLLGLKPEKHLFHPPSLEQQLGTGLRGKDNAAALP